MDDEKESPTPPRFVTARDLSRHSSDLLDAVIDGARVVVTRHGMPVAVMEATDNVALMQRARRGAATEVFEEVEEEVDLDSFGLPAEVWPVLDALSRARSVDDVVRETGLSVGEVAISLTRCEAARLAGRVLGGRLVVSKRGEQALTTWRNRD